SMSLNNIVIVPAGNSPIPRLSGSLVRVSENLVDELFGPGDPYGGADAGCQGQAGLGARRPHRSVQEPDAPSCFWSARPCRGYHRTTQLPADGWLQDIARSAARSGCTEDRGDSTTWMPRSALFSGLGVTRAGQPPAGGPGPEPALGPA